MSISASPELISLCQAQLGLLRQLFGSISAVIYLSDPASASGQPSFIPIASYPESMQVWPFVWQPTSDPTSAGVRALPGEVDSVAVIGADIRADIGTDRQWAEQVAIALVPNEQSSADPREANYREIDYPQTNPPLPNALLPNALLSDQQLMLPLIYTEVVVGLMVLMRPDRPWQEEEQAQLKGVAGGLAAGCMLEQRSYWLQQRLQNKQALQGRQSEIFHNLLHQFRNPLTALTTFGKLLVRRLNSDDPNSDVATNIVQQSQRLKELLEDFDATIELGDLELARESTGSPLVLLPGQTFEQAPGQTFEQAPGQTFEQAPGQTSEQAPGQTSDSHALPIKGLGRSLVLAPMALDVVLEPLVAFSQMVAGELGVGFWADIVKVQPALPKVMIDRQALQEVIANLLDNAIKYAIPDTWVWLQTGIRHTVSPPNQASNQALASTYRQTYQGIIVGDTGPGIPLADKARLFERNFRGVQAQGSIEGTGIGLALARELIDQMQGHIDFYSPIQNTNWVPPSVPRNAQNVPAGGAGTVFVIWLPESP
jgi:signal transduction histidine kinase